MALEDTPTSLVHGEAAFHLATPANFPSHGADGAITSEPREERAIASLEPAGTSLRDGTRRAVVPPKHDKPGGTAGHGSSRRHTEADRGPT